MDNVKTEAEGEDMPEAEGEGDAVEPDVENSEKVVDGANLVPEEGKTELLQEVKVDQQAEDNHLEKVVQIGYIHLEFKNITDIESLDRFTRLESLYLQHNKIAELKGLDN